MSSEYLKGHRTPHKPAEDQGLSLASMGQERPAYEAYMLLQQWLRDNPPPPCTESPDDWTNGRGKRQEQAIAKCGTCPLQDPCLTYGEVSGDKGSIYGGKIIT